MVNLDTPPPKNIWIAAGEGDLERVKHLVEVESLSPNVPDEYTYTPMHAAASYGQIQVLEYLMSKGGDVNVLDEDHETPLFAIESVDVAKWLVDHGADIHIRNTEGSIAAEYLAEDFPAVSQYLYSLDPSAVPLQQPTPLPRPSNYTTDQAANELTQSILTDAQAIMQRAEAEGRDPEAELREMVGRAVLGGVMTGATWAQESATEEVAGPNGRRHGDDSENSENKRQRFDDAGR